MRKKDKRKERKTAFNEDKPWKNHGDLDVISDSQRKRYEGLWVSNKGLYLDRVATKELHGLDCVSMLNLIHGSVVKKLWSRSNLPRETLQAIWDLVDFRKDGTLNKAEFIVGMWLVDQRLYGRKLPKVVNKLVWSSLGGLGVNVVIKKKRR
ncbi:EF-hand [Metschnikowia bicuspidata var. bicuspidata NRRL YB-4993]|uniref:EF-hand n=1 Tax=Metschnikowia bicuspidata var. bicuspidata NRRL YB-4993 TaxID=869754 RepID=A0A1A0H1T1_9ASCO|nr:EF-hand [Metschnikowia bicuspidata var. bicuspidata NRRL YB-4993]OBA17986.1 EF-hand [Metschnikowia bicuspidata var. bicuspidata NRRL YB-4993]